MNRKVPGPFKRLATEIARNRERLGCRKGIISENNFTCFHLLLEVLLHVPVSDHSSFAYESWISLSVARNFVDR